MKATFHANRSLYVTEMCNISLDEMRVRYVGNIPQYHPLLEWDENSGIEVGYTEVFSRKACPGYENIYPCI